MKSRKWILVGPLFFIPWMVTGENASCAPYPVFSIVYPIFKKSKMFRES
jgi:hypothetical protein